MPINVGRRIAPQRLGLSAPTTYEGEGWGLTWGGGGSFEGHVEQTAGPDRDEQEFYQTGLNLTFGNFAVGGVFEYFNDLDQATRATSLRALDAWVAGGGIAYTMDAWTFGAQYSHLDAENNASSAITDFTQDRAVLTAPTRSGPASTSTARSATPGSTPIRRAGRRPTAPISTTTMPWNSP